MEKKDIFSISIIIPTFNSETYLGACLEAIWQQDYPKKKIEIIIADGGSTDKTLDICKKYSCRILKNDKRLSEYGVVLGFKYAKNDLCIILAADNILQDKKYLLKISEPFFENEIFAVFTKHESTKEDTWYTKYWNEFTDPFNHFVYGNAANCRTFEREYDIIETGSNYIVFDFTVKNYPMLGFAQGFATRSNYQREKNTKGDDLLPIIEMIREKRKMAYVYNTAVVHHNVKDLKRFIKKYRWAVDNYLLKKNYGIGSRKELFSVWRKIKMHIWPIYAISFVVPLIRSLYRAVLEKNIIWLYHPIINFTAAIITVMEVCRIKIFRKSNIINRQ